MAKPHLEVQIFGDLITADHKVLSDNCESRNNHRYPIMVQDLACRRIGTLWTLQEIENTHREAECVEP